MSVKMMSLAWGTPAKGNDLLILLAMCDFSDDDGVLFPSKTKIFAKAKVGATTGKYIMGAYEDTGIISSEKRFRENGSQTSNITKINIRNLKNMDYDEFKRAFQERKKYKAKKNVTPLNKKCDPHQNIKNVTPPFKNVTPLNAKCDPLEPSNINHLVEPSEKYIKNWNEFAKKNGLSALRGMSAGRKEKLKTRLKNSEFEQLFDSALIEIKKSQYLLGAKGWKISFDWLIKNDENILKVVEGNYRDKEQVNKSPYANSPLNNVQTEQKKYVVGEW